MISLLDGTEEVKRSAYACGVKGTRVGLPVSVEEDCKPAVGGLSDEGIVDERIEQWYKPRWRAELGRKGR